MEPCTLYDCAFNHHYPGVIDNNKVYALDEDHKPISVSKARVGWERWDFDEKLLPPKQFYIGSHDEFDLCPEDRPSKWGFFHVPTGEIIVPPIYDYVYSFYDGLAMVILDKKTGFINLQGKIVIDIAWDEAGNFNHQVALCTVRKGNMWGLINRSGEVVAESKFNKIGRWQILFEVHCSQPWGTEMYRKWLDKQVYVALVENKGRYGYIDNHGNYLVEPNFDDARDFWQYYYAPVKQNGKWGIIEQTGQFAVPLVFSKLGEAYRDMYVVCLEKTWGILSADLKITMPKEGERYVVYNGEKIYLKNGQVTSRSRIKK